MDDERLLENERLQMEQIRELDMEELQVEEVDDERQLSSDDDDDDHLLSSGHGDGGAGPSGGFTFDTCLASMHTYLGEVDDTHGRTTFLDGGTVLNLPMFYLEGVVLFPEATLPLKVIQSRFIAAVEKALNQADARYTIGVIRVHRQLDGRPHFARIGTTAEIRQYKRLDDGSLNVVARGQQRFHLRRRWIDVEGAPCAEVQIIQEDSPLRTPRAAFAQLASVINFYDHRLPHAVPTVATPKKNHRYANENDLECMSDSSTLSDHSVEDMRTHLSSTDSPNVYGRFDDGTSSDEDFVYERRLRLGRSFINNVEGVHQHRMHEKMIEGNSTGSDSANWSSPGSKSGKGEGRERSWASNESKWSHRAPMSFWPHWVYRMYDSYSLARRAADMWRQIIGVPNMDDLVKKPDLLSFLIASKLPMSESTRQELLEIHGISYRLQREIQLLECFNRVRCRNCLTMIAKRSEMMVMSSDGPLNAYVNPHGYVHEIMTLYNASGLALRGIPVKEHSWFPGYAWTITNCAVCESNMGWLFTATKKNLRPRSFWGIRGSQVADDTG